MTTNLKDYFTTGEFARLCNVKKQTLFHYDDIGILSPEVVGENGYRYYSYTQLEIFSTISMLKELDMPLAEIKDYLDHRSPQAFLELLEQQKKEVDEKIKELQWLKRFIHTKMGLTKAGLSIPVGKILLENRPEEYLIVTEYNGEDEDKAITTAMTETSEFLSQSGYLQPLRYRRYDSGRMSKKMKTTTSIPIFIQKFPTQGSRKQLSDRLAYSRSTRYLRVAIEMWWESARNSSIMRRNTGFLQARIFTKMYSWMKCQSKVMTTTH